MPLRGSVRGIAVWPGSVSGRVASGSRPPCLPRCPARGHGTGGRRSRRGPTCKKRAEREGWVFKGERSPGGFSANSFS
jgi:hypothetical protein